MSATRLSVLARLIAIATVALGCAHASAWAQPADLRPAPIRPGHVGPFRFREAALLALEMADFHAAPDPTGSARYCSEQLEQLHARPGDLPSPWMGVLAQADACQRGGAFAAAEQLYLRVIETLRPAPGGDAADWLIVAYDHLAEHYLRLRATDLATRAFADAIALQRARLTELAATGLPPTDARLVAVLVAGKLHLADLLTRLGQIDVARAALPRAVAALREAVAITRESNELGRYAVGLYAAYFLSIALEQQGQWQDAERLWSDAVTARAPTPTSASWSNAANESAAWGNAVKEQAAFYARRGDFSRAAELARFVETRIEIAPKQEPPMPYLLDPRPRTPAQYPSYRGSIYDYAAAIAMREIQAIALWRAQGAAAAAPLLLDRKRFAGLEFELLSRFDHAAGAEGARMLGWLQDHAALQMSILLDDQPSPERVDAAYEASARWKGVALRKLAELSRVAALIRSPSFQGPALVRMLGELRDVRRSMSRQVLAAAMDGTPVDETRFLADERTEQAITTTLCNSPFPCYTNPGTVTPWIRPATVLVDLVVWSRTPRDPTLPPVRSYGAFLAQNTFHVRYVDLGPAGPIDADIAALGACLAGPGDRGHPVAVAHPPCEPSALLARLHRSLLAPLEPALAGISHVVIAPDGNLALVPFAALVADDGRLALDRYLITYALSARAVIPPHNGAGDPPSPPVVVGNPDYDAGPALSVAHPGPKRFARLPLAQAEALDVAGVLGVSPDRVLLGSEARSETIAALRSPRILHLATHSAPDLGWVVPATGDSPFEFPRPLALQSPLLQGVVAFAGANRRGAASYDGLLTALDVAGLALTGTELVVLSSCEAGRGVATDGQGLIGLRAGFHAAGAAAVVTSLWPISDKAGAIFMHLFYANLGQGPVSALRAAQLAMRAIPEYRDPYYWSGYMVSTEER